ncbi:hypothetical protein Tsubulata_009537 [Turnera subulata]|uniref:Uncharacterized protein n=1 Tax=Turnera subulata TaxID=218843 RepID=A0A9Q0FJ21_9ROSI|nr:hypothetical protein Tsubulata_009537 [Turnera subulata]
MVACMSPMHPMLLEQCSRTLRPLIGINPHCKPWEFLPVFCRKLSVTPKLLGILPKGGQSLAFQLPDVWVTNMLQC